VAVDARGMAGQFGLRIVVGPLMTQRAVLFLMLGPVVIELDASVQQSRV
jgi:hypothetical protein